MKLLNTAVCSDAQDLRTSLRSEAQAMASLKRNPVCTPAKIGERLGLLRLAIGRLENPPQHITQDRFGARAGLSQKVYTNFENKKRAPSISIGIAIRNAFGVTLDWLYAGIDHHMPFDILDEIAKLQKMPPDELRRLLKKKR